MMIYVVNDEQAQRLAFARAILWEKAERSNNSGPLWIFFDEGAFYLHVIF